MYNPSSAAEVRRPMRHPVGKACRYPHTTWTRNRRGRLRPFGKWVLSGSCDARTRCGCLASLDQDTEAGMHEVRVDL